MITLALDRWGSRDSWGDVDVDVPPAVVRSQAAHPAMGGPAWAPPSAGSRPPALASASPALARRRQLGHAALLQHLHAVTGDPSITGSQSITLSANTFGAPSVVGRPDLAVSLSYAGPRVLTAVGSDTGPLGVDLEPAGRDVGPVLGPGGESVGFGAPAADASLVGERASARPEPTLSIPARELSWLTAAGDPPPVTLLAAREAAGKALGIGLLAAWDTYDLAALERIPASGTASWRISYARLPFLVARVAVIDAHIVALATTLAAEVAAGAALADLAAASEGRLRSALASTGRPS